MAGRSRRDFLKTSVAAGAIVMGAGLAQGADAEAGASAGVMLTLDGSSVRTRVHGASRGRLPGVSGASWLVTRGSVDADAPGKNRTCARGLGNRCSIH